MNSINFKCPNCDAEIIINNNIKSVICGCCMKEINVSEITCSDWRLKPPEFIVINETLEKYIGESSRGIRTPPDVKVINRWAFSCFVLEVYVSDGVEEIKANAFDCQFLRYLRLPDSIKKIENRSYKSGEKDYAIDLNRMIRNNPVKPCIECSDEVKCLLLADYNDKEKAELEEKIKWR